MNEIIFWLTDNFNNRQIAIGLWLALGVLLISYSNKTRDNLKGVFSTILQGKLLIMFGSLAVYLTGFCWLLSKLSLWTADQFIPTILWFLLSGVLFLGRSLSAKEDGSYFKNLIFDSFKVTAIFEFIVVAYTFHILIELLLVPIFVLLGAVIAFSEGKDEHRKVKNLFEAIAVVIVVGLLWNSVSQVLQSPGQFFTTENGYNFILPILLTIGSLPFFYFWYCYASYETVSNRLGYIHNSSYYIQQYVKRRFFLSYFFRPWLLQRAVRQLQISPSNNIEDIELIIQEIKEWEKNSNNPPVVNKKEGWSPYKARDFLKEHNLRTSDYHSTGGDDWWAGSSYVNLDDQILPNTISYYLKGQKGIVNNLKLTGNFYTDLDPKPALAKFREIAVTLTENAMVITAAEAAMLITDVKNFETSVNETKISCHINEYPTKKGFYADFILLKMSNLHAEESLRPRQNIDM